jgi:membrane fusion protein (multidrug efflux system)
MDEHPAAAIAPPEAPAVPADRTGFWVKIVLGLVFVLFAGALGYVRWQGGESTNDAYVSGHIHAVAPRVAGTIEEVLVNDNQHVEAGEVLARLDARDFAVREQLAHAQIAQAQAQKLAAEAQIRVADASIASARSNLRKAELDFARSDELMRERPRGISRQEFDAAQAARDAARAMLDSATAQLAAARANRAATQAVEDTGRANLREASLALSYVEIHAPVTGRVGRKSVESGARVNVGQTLMAIVGDEVWVVANFREVQLGKLRPGTPMKLKIDALPGKVFTGRVQSLSPATGAEFALLPPDNATGNFTKVAQRVPVKILFDPQELAPLRAIVVPGLSVVVELADPGSHNAQGKAAGAAARSPPARAD